MSTATAPDTTGEVTHKARQRAEAGLERLRVSHRRLIDAVEVLVRDHPDPGAEVFAAVWEARHIESGGAS